MNFALVDEIWLVEDEFIPTCNSKAFQEFIVA